MSLRTTLGALLLLASAPLALAQSPQQLWSADPGTPLASTARMVVDSTGHAVTCSGTYLNVSVNQSHHLFQVSRIDPTGQVLWTREYRPAGGWSERAYWVALDSADNIVVTGRAKPSQSAGFRAVTIKYDPLGNELWRHVRTGTSTGHTAVRVELDASDNVYVLGSGEAAGSLMEIRKLDPNGQLLWERGHTPVTNLPVRLNALAVGHDGRVAATTAINDLDFFTRCYDTNGNLLWSRTANGGLLGGQDVAFDASGAAYVCGTINLSGAIVKYGPTGNVEWTMLRNGPNVGWDSYHRLAIDVNGDIVATGQGAGTSVYLQWATVKVTPSGTLLWARDFAGLGGNDERARMITTDATGAVYVGGFALPAAAPCTTTPSDVDTVAVKYDAAGNQQWVLHSECSGGFGNSIAVAPNGDVLLNTPGMIERWEQIAAPSTYCAAVPNSTGQIGHLGWTGSTEIAAGNFEIVVTGTLPPFVFGLLAASRLEASVPQAGGTVGTLCLGAPTGRGPVFQIDATGSVTLPVDPLALPTASGIPIAAVAGETWNFQIWHRDFVAGTPNANFTDALRVPWR